MFADSFIGLGRTLHPVPFGAPDGQKTDLFFLICCQNDRLHLHVLARLCVMGTQTDLLSKLRSAPSTVEMAEGMRLSEKEAIKLG